jgi:hypothetical protein
MNALRSLAFVTNADKPGAPELTRELLVLAKAAGVNLLTALFKNHAPRYAGAKPLDDVLDPASDLRIVCSTGSFLVETRHAPHLKECE